MKIHGTFFSLAVIGLAATVAACSSGSYSTSGGLPAWSPSAPIAVTGISLNKATTSMLLDGSETLVATITPTGATSQPLKWQSSDPLVATVSSEGVLTAVKEGTAKITVTTVDSSKEASVDVTVERYGLVKMADSATYYDNTDCVLDSKTGLIWEGKTANGNTRDKHKSYTNYYDINNIQLWDGNAFRKPTQDEINATNNTIGYVNAVNGMSLCGFTNWRLPTREELQLLVKGNTAPRIDTTWFTNTQRDRYDAYWTSSSHTSLNPNDSAYFVSFYFGTASTSDRGSKYCVQLVRSAN